MKKFFRKMIKGTLRIVALLIIFAAALYLLSRALTPYFNRHLPDIEAMASKTFSRPVKIEQAYLSWAGYEPALTLNQVSILEKTTRVPRIRIQQIKMTFNLIKSLWAQHLLLDKLRIQGVHLMIHEEAKGALNIAGFYQIPVSDTLTGASLKSNEILNWIFSQRKLILDDIDIRYRSYKGIEQTYLLHRGMFENQGNTHSILGVVGLKQDTPTQAVFKIRWEGVIEDLSHASAQLYFYLEGVSLPQWLAAYQWQGWSVTRGLGSTKIWATWKANDWDNIQSQFQFYEVELNHQKSHQQKIISRLNGQMTWEKEGDKRILKGEDIFIDFPTHLWPATDFSLTFVPDAQHQWTLKTMEGNYLNLADTVEGLLASQVIPKAWRQPLLASRLRGELIGFRIDLPSQKKINWDNFQLSTQLNQISFAPIFSFPGFRHLTGELNWDGKKGHVRIEHSPLTMEYPRWFSTPLQFDHAYADLAFNQQENTKWVFKANKIQLSNNDLTCVANADVLYPTKGAPVVYMNSDFSVAHAEHLAQYLPLSMLTAEMAHWLNQAFLGGQISNGQLTVPGNWRELAIKAKATDFQLRYAPEWPVFTHLTGELNFNHSTLTVEEGATGFIYDIPITHMHAVMTQIGLPAPTVLTTSGTIETDSSQGIYFIHHSPLEKNLGQELGSMTLKGPLTLNLALTIPLAHPLNTAVFGKAKISQGLLQIPTWRLSVESLEGPFQFTEESIQATSLTGRLLQAPIQLSLVTQGAKNQPKVVRANWKGSFEVSHLENWLALPLSAWAKGQMSYQAELNLTSQSHSQPTHFILQSDLKGMNITLPAPYGKAEALARDLKLELFIKPDQPLKAQLRYSDLLTTAVFDKQAAQGLTWIRLQIARVADALQAKLSNTLLEGEILFPDKTGAPVRASFQRLNFSSTLMSSQTLLKPKTLPPLIFEAQAIQLGDKNLGAVRFETTPTAAGLDIKYLSMTSPVLTLHAAGQWTSTGVTHLIGELSSPRVNDLLSQWGYEATNLVASKGNAKFNLTWPDAPYRPALSSMAGTLMIYLDQGRIINLSSANAAKIGVGRMLNILSLESIPRRLSLNFSDIFQKGYSFDYIKGAFTLKNGNAQTENMQVNGPVARIDIRGRIGYLLRDYEINMSVQPYVTSSLPVVVGVFNPIAGVATWVANKMIVNKEISKVTSYRYRITGSWDDPVWEKI